jgi:4-hydroxy-4-methyl-2-oxoglutarate aldolase
MAEAVVARTEEVMSTEGEVRRHIMAGMDPQEAYKRYGKF